MITNGLDNVTFNSLLTFNENLIVLSFTDSDGVFSVHIGQDERQAFLDLGETYDATEQAERFLLTRPDYAGYSYVDG